MSITKSNQLNKMKSIQLHPVAVPTIGHRYHTAWSNNKFMTWVLIAIYPDGRCLLGSKLSRFETQLTDLRTSSMVPNRSKQQARQLEIAFINKLVLT